MIASMCNVHGMNFMLSIPYIYLYMLGYFVYRNGKTTKSKSQTKTKTNTGNGNGGQCVSTNQFDTRHIYFGAAIAPNFKL